MLLLYHLLSRYDGLIQQRQALSPTLRGLLWVILAGLSFVVFMSIVRYVGNELHPVQTAFIRYGLGVFVLAPLFYRQGLQLLATTQISRHALRGFFHAVGVMLWFYAVTKMPLAEVTALSFISPIFVVIGAAIFLRERLSAMRLLAVIVGIAGVMVILRPGAVAINTGAIAILLAAPLFAASKLLTKALVRRDSIGTVVVYLSLFSTLAMLFPALWVWQTPDARELILLGATALFATISHLCMTRGLQLVDVTVVQPVEFLQLVWSTLIGLVLFSEEPSVWVWIGAGIIISGATLIVRYESKTS